MGRDGRRWAAAAAAEHCDEAARFAQRHRQCSHVLRLRASRLGDGPGAERGWRQVTAAVEAHLAAHTDDAIRELEALCRLPSVSTDPAYKAGILAAAEFMADALRRSGFLTVETIETAGHPLIFAQSPHVAGAPTILVYGHYDVQPPDPL